MAAIEISELTSTWGCSWQTPTGSRQYGFKDAPVGESTKTWLGAVGGDAVIQLMAAGFKNISRREPGSYGGECVTILVNTDLLDAHCRAYWNRQNAREHQQSSDSCHYCGMHAAQTGAFGEPVCAECV